MHLARINAPLCKSPREWEARRVGFAAHSPSGSGEWREQRGVKMPDPACLFDATTTPK
jgi:hypothetical protein